MSESAMLTRVLKAAVSRGASDVHAKAGDVFRARVNGQLVPLTRQRLTPAQTRALAATFSGIPLDDPRLESLRDFDGSWGVAGVGRFRVNILRQRSSFMIVLRVIPFSVPTLEGLNLPDVVREMVEFDRGLVIVAGPAGSGRTSTIAAMVDHLNRTTAGHVITLEDPIEFLHRDLHGSVTQREVGTDTPDLASGVQAASRQDPDVLVVAELSTPAVVARAIRAAESGCLVIAAMSAPDVASVILQLGSTAATIGGTAGPSRLASVLRGVVVQRLVSAEDGEGRMPEVEWVEITAGLRAAIAGGNDLSSIREALEEASTAGDAELFPEPGAD